MSDLLGIGSSAVSAYRSALAAIGENVANAETPGYARRSVRLQQATSAGAPDPLYRETVMFGGVRAAAVNRAWDSYLAAEARHAAAAAGKAEAKQQWLGRVEAAFGEGAASVGGALTAFFNAGTSLAADPVDQLGRSAMLMALGDAAGAFRDTAAALTRVTGGIATSAQLEIDAANAALSTLHNINSSLRVAPASGTARASLEDERDRLIDFLAARLDIGAAIGGDGTAAITFSGASSISLLSPTGPAFLSMKSAADGRLSFLLSKEGTTLPLPAAGGRLAGLEEVAASTAANRDALDRLALDFAAAINRWSAAGIDAAGEPGADMLEATGGALSMKLVISDPSRIAAAVRGGAGNGNLLVLDALRGAGGAEARWEKLVSGTAQMLAGAKTEATAAGSWRDQSYAALDEVTGINLDHEAAELLRFQQAYNGSAKIIQVARETIKTILDLI